MIPKDCKRLAEVDFPIAEVSRHAAQEKSIRHGHPSTLHLWWARRPLASSRAVLLGLLWPDPCDPLCPEEFKQRTRALLPEVQGQVGPTDEDLRKKLLKFIGDFANWDLAAHRSYLEVSRALVKAAHLPAGGQAAYEPPLVVDPFAGGGSIPLEALRLGCEAFASDLNPVACLILKVMLEDIPRHGPSLASELRRVGAEIKRQAEKELADLYPKDPDGATPIAYLWARTVRCEAPNCGAEIPLARSFWLCKKPNRKRALKHSVVRPAGEVPRVEFEVFEPKAEKNVPTGTVTHAKAMCVACGAVLPPSRVRAQLIGAAWWRRRRFRFQKARSAGGARMLAVLTLRHGRHYRLPTERDYEAVRRAQERLAAVIAEWERAGKQGLCPVPDEPLPLMSGTFNVPIYGMNRWGDLFTARQKVAFVSLVRLIREIRCDDAPRYLLSLVSTKLADRCNSVVNWSLGVECPNQLFKGNAIPMGWDFAESNILSESSASVHQSVENIAKNVEATFVMGVLPSHPSVADACESPLPDQAAAVWFTDPPYYFAVPYADLSDFFFVWLKRALLGHPLLHDPFDRTNVLTPKERELCEMAYWDRVRYAHKDQRFFEDGMSRAFADGRRVLREEGIGSVVFAHKTTEGWEALLSGMIRGGWSITGSWPIATERYSRLRARDSAALATSVHLVCRPRSDDAPVGDWADVLRELPNRVGDWMERLQGEGVRGADLVFACIGPALEIFSRYAKVETADGREVALAQYLEKVWEVVGRSALAQVLGTARPRPATARPEPSRRTRGSRRLPLDAPEHRRRRGRRER